MPRAPYELLPSARCYWRDAVSFDLWEGHAGTGEKCPGGAPAGARFQLLGVPPQTPVPSLLLYTI